MLAWVFQGGPFMARGEWRDGREGRTMRRGRERGSWGNSDLVIIGIYRYFPSRIQSVLRLTLEWSCSDHLAPTTYTGCRLHTHTGWILDTVLTVLWHSGASAGCCWSIWPSPSVNNHPTQCGILCAKQQSSLFSHLALFTNQPMNNWITDCWYLWLFTPYILTIVNLLTPTVAIWLQL